MKETRNSDFAPSFSQRETVGLMGTFLLLLIGAPGHSETTVHQIRQIVDHFIRWTLVLLGLLTPAAQPPASLVGHQATPFHHKILKAKSTALPSSVTATLAPMVGIGHNGMFLRTQSILHHLTYVFGGIATSQGQPYAHANVVLRLISDDRGVTQEATTAADGSYKLSAAIDAEDGAPINWTLDAYTSDNKKVELTGCRIVQNPEELEKTPIVVTTPVELMLSSAAK